jgi:hypothetical protein
MTDDTVTYVFEQDGDRVEVDIPAVHDGTSGGPRFPEPEAVRIERTVEMDQTGKKRDYTP